MQRHRPSVGPGLPAADLSAPTAPAGWVTIPPPRSPVSAGALGHDPAAGWITLRAPLKAETDWTRVEERARETVYASEVEFAPGHWPKDAQPLRYVAVKFVGKQLDLEGKFPVKHLAVVSNRRDLSAEALLKWHWGKAGTIEHVHDVVKNELGGGSFPSGKFGANAAWFRFALLTYNVLSALKTFALPPPMETARPKRLRFALFSLAARITSHAGAVVLKIGRRAEAIAGLVASRLRLAKLAPA